MNKSIIERIFPHSPSSRLPTHEHLSHPSSTASSPTRISLRDSSSSPRTRQSPSNKLLEPAPFGGSVVHYDDPFLPIERASRALQTVVQELLDAQTDGLNASLGGAGIDDLSSVGSLTPTPSVATPSRSIHGVKTVPVRQPLPKKITLGRARRGLVKSMEELAHLKAEELRIIGREVKSRQEAVKRTITFENKKTSLASKIESIQGEDATAGATALRTEANKLEIEIRDLEDKLYAMKVRHRHLVSQASQLQNSVDSKLSSYKASLALLEKDVGQFLRQPPVSYSLADFDTSVTTHGGIYALKPERRTLEMAQEQWTTEQDILSQREASVQDEQRSLRQGAIMWREAMLRINEFEKDLRKALAKPRVGSASLGAEINGAVPSALDIDSTPALLTSLSEVIKSLQADLAEAESKDWNLLICCLAAELEALEQGRELLGGHTDSLDGAPIDGKNVTSVDTVDGDHPEALLRTTTDTNGSVMRNSSAGSNRSLEDTLREFGGGTKGKSPLRTIDNDVRRSEDRLSDDFEFHPTINTDARSESEDDDPGPDFFLSRS